MVYTLILSGIALATIVWNALGHQRRYSEPLRQLLNLLPRVHANAVAIDELKKVGGKLGPLAGQIQEILHDLRQQRSAVARLEADLSHRVASRTSALERKIGSLREQAVRDPLTGLYNRRMLDTRLPVAMEQCREKGLSLSLLMMDVDHFKKLNDTLGHGAGDELLRNIAQLIRSSMGEGDLAFRCGGDEFVALLEGFDAEAAQAMAVRLTSLVDALARTLRVTPKPRLSIGVATRAELGTTTPEEFMKEADKLLYKAKGTRRRATDIAAKKTDNQRLSA